MGNCGNIGIKQYLNTSNYIAKKEDCQFEISKELFPKPKEHKKGGREKKGTGERSKTENPFSPFLPIHHFSFLTHILAKYVKRLRSLIF